MADLTDRELATRLRVHPRTIQRWCNAGKLPGAYKAGRSWRIPRAAARAASLEGSPGDDDGTAQLRAAAAVFTELWHEIELMKQGRPPRTSRNWTRLATETEKLERALQGLPKHLRYAPPHLAKNAPPPNGESRRPKS